MKKVRIPPAAVILGAMVLGVIIGYMIFISYPDKKTAATIAGYISLISDIFLRLIKMLIAPLVFSTLVVGIAHMGDASSVGRVFAKALGWFITASLISLLLGMILANTLQPGHNLGLPLPDIGSAANLATAKFTVKDFVTHLVPTSFAEALANNEILQIVVFSMFFGIACAAMGEKAKTLIALKNTRPTEAASPMCAMPTTSVENTSGPISILISRRKTSDRIEMYPAICEAVFLSG